MNIKSILLPILLALAPAARATLYYHIDGESGGVLTTGSASYTATGSVTAAGYTQNYSLPTYTLTQTNNTNCVEQNTVSKFGFVVNPDGDYNAPLIVSGTDTVVMPFRGSGYLQFSYPAFQHPDGSGRSSPPGNKNTRGLSTDAADKVMVAFAPHYNGFGNQHDWNPASVQRRDIGRYVGFALYIPDNASMPIDNNRWTILYQAFQLGTGGRPPFAITITRGRNGQQGNTVELSFGIRDNDDTDTPEGNKQQTSSSDIESTTQFGTVTISRREWYSFVIYQLPSSDSAIGRVKVWMTRNCLPPSTSPELDEKYCVFDFKGKWGYPNPQKSGGTTNPDRDLFSGQLGLYSNDTSKSAHVLFDEIKFADTYDEANPDTVPASQKPVITGFDGGTGISPELIIPGQRIQITGNNLGMPLDNKLTEVWFGDAKGSAEHVDPFITAWAPHELNFSGKIILFRSGWAVEAPGEYRVAGAPVGLLKPNDQTVSAGHGVSLVAATESEMAITFRWEYSPDNGHTWLNAIGSNYTTSDRGRVFSIVNASASLDGYKYRYIVTSMAGEATSKSIRLTVAPATLDAPAALVVNNTDGALYVTDTAHHAIYRITGAATASLLAGAPSSAGMADASGSAAKFNTPSGVAINTVSNLLLVADTGNHLIRTVTATGSVGTLAGGGAAGMADGAGAQAAFNQPAAVAVDSAGNAYVADSLNHTIRKITPYGEVSTLAGAPGVSGTLNGASADARFNTPSGIAVDAANYVYVADTGNHAIRLITPARAVSTLAGSPDSAHAPAGASHQDGPGAVAWFDHPTGIALNADGRLLYIADRGNAAIRTIDETDTVRTLILTAGSPITSPASGTDNNNSGGTGGGGGSSSGGSSNGGGGGAPCLYFFAALAALATLRRFQ
jgi:sugar lactone lactonase YvrE